MPADDDYGQKTVSVLLDGQETDLEIIDHPACEMSVSVLVIHCRRAYCLGVIISACHLQTESFCSTYNIDHFVVVYSVVDRRTFKVAEQILHYLRDSEMLLTRGAILVGNKTDLERHREVTRQGGWGSPQLWRDCNNDTLSTLCTLLTQGTQESHIMFECASLKWFFRQI